MMLQNRTGETNIAKNGMKMTICEYINANNIRILFEDNTLVENKKYGDFKRGSIGHPFKKANTIANKHIGETNIANNGMTMTIIEYRNKNDIDIQFENGIIRKNIYMSQFRNGAIGIKPSRKDDRTGETNIAKNGMKMTIIDGRNAKNLTVQFDDKDQSIRENIGYHDFQKGLVSPKKKTARDKTRIGETKLSNDGVQMTIIEYETSYDMTVQFSDGETRKTKYSNFKKGLFRYGNQIRDDRIGEKFIAQNNMSVTIIEYNGANDITVLFQDGMIATNKQYCSVSENKTQYPTKHKTLKIGALAYYAKNKWAFYVKCEKCGLSDIMTYEQMQNHICKKKN